MEEWQHVDPQNSVTAETLISKANKQVDYILGDNPAKRSYMVGFGDKYPQYVHHRGSSLYQSMSIPIELAACNDGFQYLNAKNKHTSAKFKASKQSNN
ncbi:hypothetical protein ACFX11_015139 [Malus domestica]